MADRSDFNDLADEQGLEVVAELVNEAVKAAPKPRVKPADVSAPNWPDPMLPGALSVPDIPTSILPGWVGKMAEAVAATTQTPPAMAVMMSLSVLATAVHRRFEVAPFGEEDGYSEPLSIWTLSVLPSGSRKTAVINALCSPFVHWEKIEYDRGRKEIIAIRTARKIAEDRIKKLTKDAVNAENDNERERIRKLIEEEETNMPAEIRAPRLFTGDITAESLQGLLVDHGERMAVLSDEPGIFNVMAGMYSGGMSSLDVFLQGHAGSPLRVDRSGRNAHVDKPALTFGLALQPGVLADLASSRRFRDSGLLARFLFAMPKSNVGTRDVRQRRTIPSYVQRDYESKLFDLLEGRANQILTKPRKLPMTDSALDAWLELSADIEARIGEGGDLEAISDWGSKLPGAVARIAALLELAESGLGAPEVSHDVTMRAVALGRLLIDHAHAAFGLLGADATDGDAAAVVKWAVANNLARFNKSAAQKAMEGRFNSVSKLNKAIERLEAGDVVRVEKVPNKGARPTTLIHMNPKLLREST